MANRIQLRRDTTINWNTVNPVLSDGEPGLETDTNKIKYGDGSTAWLDLAYASGGSGGGSLTDVDGVVAFPGDLLIGTLWPEDPMPGGDKESVVWAKDDTEYLGLWWGGDQTYPNPMYGPVAGIMIGAYDPMTDDFTSDPSPVDTNITIGINDSTGTTLEWRFDRDGILKMPPGNETTAGWIQWSHANDDLTNVAGAGFVDYFNAYTGLGLTAPTDTNAEKGIWFGTPADPTSPFQPETSMVFRNDTLYLPKNGYIKSHDINRVGYANLTTVGTTITIQTNNEHDWVFGTDGNLTFPDSTTQSTAFNITKFGEGFSLNGADKIVTNKLYSTNASSPTQHYRLELDTNGVVVLPDQSIINGSTIRGIYGTGELNYTGITIGPDAAHREESWVWVDHTGVSIATEYSTDAYTWKFDNNGDLTVPGEIHSAAGTGPVVVQSNDGNNTRTWTFGTNGRITFPDATVQKTAFQDVAAHVYFVHPVPGNTYTATGTINSPYNTITAAINAAVAAGHNDANCAVVILLANITENITLKPGIFLTSLGTGTHGSPNITGTVTVTSSSGDTVSNHYSISNLRIIAPSNGHCINFTGTFPQKLFVRDMWLDANGSGDCIYMDNTGTGSTVQFDTGHLAHSGSGDVYCFSVVHGGCYVTDIETTGACQVAAVQAGATMTIDRSELDANGDIVVETYGSGTIVITNSSINNIKANSTGVALNDAAGVATIGNCLFNIPAGSGYSVQGATGSHLYAANNVFLTANLYRSTGITYTALPTTWLTKA
jgi:hypothetical protein